MYRNLQQKDFARELRSNSTDAERLLWSRLRKRQLGGMRFRRQFPIGPYIVDFECFERKLVIELDGGQHNEVTKRECDLYRTSEIEKNGYRVVRFWNFEVLEGLDCVLEAIAKALNLTDGDRPHPGPPPEGEGVR